MGDPEPVKTPWWCDNCQIEVEGRDVTFQECHDERAGGCGGFVRLSCPTCNNVGWIAQRLGGYSFSSWSECPDCHNPIGIPAP